MKQTIARAAFIVLMACVIAAVDGASRGMVMPPDIDKSAMPTIRITVPPPAETVETPAIGEQSKADEFTAKMLDDLIQSGSAILVDARSEEEYLEGHIPQAMNLPVEELGGSGIELIQFLLDVQKSDSQMQVIVYCGGGDCHSSELVGRKLKEYGVDSVFIFEGGFPAWLDAGYASE